MKKILLSLAVAALAGWPALGDAYYYSPDVPTNLVGTDYLPWDVVRRDGGTLSVPLSLPRGTALDALHRMDSGDWLLSVEAPTDLGGTDYDPRDLVRFDAAGTYSPFFCGGALPMAVPPGSNVDAAFLRGGDSGPPVVSFDVPTSLGGIEYDPADLVELIRTGPLCSDWIVSGLVFDASAAGPGVPLSTNVSGADARGGRLVITFDVPTDLGATFLPGDLVTWDGAVFSLFTGSGFGWKSSSRLDALAFLGDPGDVRETLVVTKVDPAGSTLNLDWAASCSAEAEDYGIAEGSLGTWYSHAPIDCSDAFHDLNEDVTAGTGSRYYLVFAHHANDEGTYGRDSGGGERPRLGALCQPTQVISPCP